MVLSLELFRQELHDECLRLIKKHGHPKMPRTVYCKYCYRKTLPVINYYEGIVQCGRCNYGLAPIKDLIIIGGWRKWNHKIEKEFAEEYEKQKQELQQKENKL